MHFSIIFLFTINYKIKTYAFSMQEKEEEMYLRDDMVEFATDISQSNFNVKQFKKLHAAKQIKVANQKTRTRIYTEHRDSLGLQENSSLHSKTVGQGLNKTLRYNDSHISVKRQAKMFSKPTVKSADRMELIRSRKKLSSQEKTGSNLQKYQKEWSKGKIKEKCIEEWLNSILVEYCQDQYFDKNIANSALKKLGIDENSLVAKGLPPQNVTRLYRGLFVFGMGFNSIIGELANGNMEVLKTIWRIYSIILEYCSKGGMVTVIGQIERDTSTKVAALTTEIVRRQEIIQRNEELNQEKNGEIFRQIKKLREDNTNLNNQKTVLVEEYNATEQAFSEEVGLRLKFQTKINEIYGLHRELGIKHQKLYQQFSTKVQELRICADKYFQATIKSQEFRETQYKLREQLILLKMSSRKDKEYLDQLLRQRIELITKNSKLEFHAIQAKNEITQLKHKEKLWLNDKINLESMLQFREKSAKETHSEYQITLIENNRLYILLSDQRKVMEEYQKQKKNFNSKVISIVSENSYHKRKMEQNQRKYDNLQESYKELQQRMEQLNLQVQIKTKSQESYQSFFNNNQQNLIQLRRINNANEEELTFLRKYYKDMEKVLKNKNEGYENLMVKYQTAFEQLETTKAELMEVNSKYTLLAQQKRINQEVFDIKQAKIKVMQEELKERQEELQKNRLKFSAEEERLRLQLDKIAVSYKNEKFQRNTLNSSYNQTLKIIEQKNKNERQQTVKISLLQGEIEKEKSRYRVLEKNMVRVIEDFGRLQDQLQGTLNQQRRLIVEKQDYVHQMFIHDLSAEIQREIERNNHHKIKIKNLLADMQKERKQNQMDTEKLHYGYKHQIALITKQSQKRIQHLNTQLSFEKKENANLKTTVKYYQDLADSYRKKISERQTSQREEIYKHTIEEKKKEMEKMLTEMQKLQDQLQHTKKVIEMRGDNLTESQLASFDESSERLKLIDSLKRELQQEFQMKLKELQRQMKREYARKQAELRQEYDSYVRNLSVQEILKIKEMRPNDLLKQLSITQKSNQFKDLTSKNSFDIHHQSHMRGQMVRAQDSKKRRQITRIIKNAYEYYN